MLVDDLIYLVEEKHTFCIPKSFNTNILYQLFDYKITFENSQLDNKNSIVDFLLKNRFETFILKISGIQK